MVHAAGVGKSSIANRFSWQLLVSADRQYTITNSIISISLEVFCLPEPSQTAPIRYAGCFGIRNMANAPIFTLILFLAALFVAGIAGAARAQETRPPKHDYPTSVRADYVIGCLAANGFQHKLLDQCACSIDAIADQMSYDDYERAETILSMQQASVGPRGGLFRDTPVAKQSMQQIQRAQAEANLRCGQ